MRLLKQLWIVIGAAIAVFVVSWIVYMPNAEQRGVWRAATGGNILRITPLTAKLYSESSASCVEQLTFPAHLKLVEMAEGATLNVTGDTMLLHVDGALDPLPFIRIADLPERCAKPNANAASIEVFDALWAAMDEHYAFFDLHNVDWDARRSLAPDENLSDDALFQLLSDTLVGLDDGHVQLVSPDANFSPSSNPDWLPEAATFTRDDVWQAARDVIGTDLTPVELTGIEYTLMPDGIGYIMIRHMSLNTPFNTLSEPAMASAFAEVAAALSDAKALIIDLRYNPGGSDSVSFGIASHFTAQPLDVLTKTTRNGDTQTTPFIATVQPVSNTPLNQPTLILTSNLTGSAAEIFTMALREMPQVTIMGENTGGGLSDILSFTLPNGWELGLSHQTYLTMDGTLFEGTGLPVDIPFEIETAPLARGEDPLLRAAFDQARNF